MKQIYVRIRGFALCALATALIGVAHGQDAGPSGALPILLEGGILKAEEAAKDVSGEPRLAREVDLPTRGVWYLWLQATHQSQRPAGQGQNAPVPVMIKYNLDGKQPLRGPRAVVPVTPFTTLQWLSYTRANPPFMAQVYVDKPGKHTLNLEIENGVVKIDRIALTLFDGAVPKGDTLDHTGDPGMGRSTFPQAEVQADGFREDWSSPSIQVSGKAYHLDSEKGNNDSDGMSPETAWKNLSKANAATFAPGDALLLKRGGAWQEGLAPKGNGTPAAPISIGAYGEGARPLINGINRPGITLIDQSHWAIQDVQVTSDAEYGDKGGGILVQHRGGPPRPKGIAIRNCIAFDTGGTGIAVGALWDASALGYDGVVIENCLAYANAGAGIEIGGFSQKGGRNSVIRNCTAFANTGMAGLWIHSGENGLIEHSVGHNNAVFQVWTWNAINVTMRYCEGYRALAIGDRGGFDIDWGCIACTLEYSYSHHNYGPGALLMGSGNDKYAGYSEASRYNLCRYNVLSDDGGIVVMENFEDGKVYNNTVVAHYNDWGGRDQGKTVLDVYGWNWKPGYYTGGWPARNEFFNNILMGRDRTNLLWVDEDASKLGNVFDRNVYWRLDGAGTFALWGGRWLAKPKEYQDLKAFNTATGHESHGAQTDPKLSGAGASGIGRLPLDEYRPGKDADLPSIGRPVLLSKKWLKKRREFLTDTGAETYGISMEPKAVEVDYWGNPLDSADTVTPGAGQMPGR